MEMLRHLDPTKIERHGESHILDFLRAVTRPAESGYGNVHNKRDLVLPLGDTAYSPVVLEVKGSKNPAEMWTLGHYIVFILEFSRNVA